MCFRRRGECLLLYFYGYVESVLMVVVAGINSNMRRYIGIRGLDIRSITPLMLMMGMILLVPSASD